MSTSLRRTPLFEAHRSLGARLVEYAGWEMPVQYSGVTDEHQATRNAVGVFDVSHMGELHLEGPGAAACLNTLITNDLGKLASGRALYTVACNEQGTILDDLIVYRIAAEHFLVVCNAANLEKMHAHFAQHTRGQCEYQNRSDSTALLALQGPRAAELVQVMGAVELSALPRFGVVRGTLAGVEVLAARTGYTGEDGYELFCASDAATTLWQALLDKGAAQGIKPIGLAARDTLRLEARLALYGNEIDETTTPLEAGLGWVVKLDKPSFLGRDALLAQRERGLSRKLVGFEMVGRGIARHGHAIVSSDGTHTLGHVTSGAPGLSVGKNIGLGYVPTDQAELGTRIDILIRDKPIEARICPTPFYKRS
ncbi:MAG TPA: glycine cleavage system aminomethyltransferase GcvT [Polyangiales bacterium]|nr:glycine cleavage system aminomethyltransferase GcvT [Polyangiales bacterium]